jgi:hypothetical protein
VLGAELASSGDMFIRADKPGEKAKAFNVLAEGLACMAFSRLGVEFEGIRWEAK